MSSFSAAGAGVKPCTFILAGKQGYASSSVLYAPLFASCVSAAYTASSSQVMLTVTGAGYLTFSAFLANTTSTSATVKITIDGVVVLNDIVSSNLAERPMSQVGSIMNTSGGSAGRSSVAFNKSLLVECTCNVAALYLYDYYLT